jgi:hypothetical protein
MRTLAEFIMSSRMRAVMGISALGLLSLLMPPLALLSSAAVALVVQRKGIRAGGEALLLSAMAAGALGFLALGNGFAVSGYLLLQWLPMVALAAWLRFSRSLAQTLTVALIASSLLILLPLLVPGGTDWDGILKPLDQAFAEAELLDAAAREQVMAVLADWMVAILAVGFFLQSAFSLILARWWQAMLYNPGGFRAEFHELRLPRALSAVTMAIAVLASFNGEQAGTLDFLALLLLAGYFFQGLALVHGAVAIRKLSTGWLVGMYILVIIAMIQTATILAAAGLADAWLDFRRRLAARDAVDETPPND